jgi:predicted DNA-binding transcriptional regulator AlpA
MEQKFLSVADVAKLIGVSIPSIWRWSRINAMPRPIKLGPNRTAWSVADLDAWLAAKTVAPTPPDAAPVAARRPCKSKPSFAAAAPVEAVEEYA